MSDLRFTLTGDGPSDEVLLRPLRWLLRQHVRDDIAIQPQWADLRSLREKPRGLAERVRSALDFYPCDLLFVHRDAEKDVPSVRRAEIERALADVSSPAPSVCVIPVRMTEAWLLFDEQAVRLAAGNPNGRQPLDLPHRDPERLPDPKSVLRRLLQDASGLSTRRLRGLNTSHAVRRVAEYIEDFSPLRGLPAFRTLECDLLAVLDRNQWR